MTRLCKLILGVSAAMLLMTPALASDYGAAELENSLPEQVEELIGGVGLEDAYAPGGALGRLWEAATERLSGIVRAAVGSAVSLAAVALICGLAAPLVGDRAAELISMGGVMAAAMLAAGDAGAFIALGRETLSAMSDFSHALLPCLTTAAAAGGAVTSAAAKYAATALFLDVLITLCLQGALPLVYAYLAAAVAGCALGSEALSGAARLMKWLTTTVLTLIMTLFTTYLTVAGAVTGSADAAAAKAAKAALSAALPVVGGIVSDAAGTVVAAAGLLRNGMGVLGLIAVSCVCMVPFLTLGARYLLYKAAAALSSAFADKRVSGAIGAVGSAFGMVLGMTGACAVMLFLSVISIMKAVTP